MLPEKHLSKLKKLSKQLKTDIDNHHYNDPGNIDENVNKALYGALITIEELIRWIENNNNTTL